MSYNYVISKEEGKSYLVRERTEEEEQIVDSGEINIRGLLKGFRRFRDGKEYYAYDISARKTLDEVYGIMSAKDIRGFLISIERVREELYEYLLSEEDIVFLPECIYMSSDLSEYFFIYDSTKENDFSANLQTLSEFLITHADHNDDEAVALAYRFYTDAACECMNIIEILKMETEEKEKEVTEEKIVVGEQVSGKKISETLNIKKMYYFLPVIPVILIILTYNRYPRASAIILTILIMYVLGIFMYLLAGKKSRKLRVKKEKVTQ